MSTLATDVDWRTVSLPGIDSSAVAIVLGAGGAIGGAVAGAMAAMGASVAVATRDRDRSSAVAAKIGSAHPVLPAVADLAEEGSLAAMVAEVSERLGTPTVLVNSAAVGAPHADITEVARHDVSTMFETNVIGAYEAAQAVAPAMRAAGYGRIVNVASVAAMLASRGSVAYGVSKAAVISLTEHLAVELSGAGITVNSVSPGQTPTKLRSIDEAPGSPQELANGSNTAIPLGRRGLLDDYVGAILFLSSRLAGYITGVDIPVEGGIRLVRPKSF